MKRRSQRPAALPKFVTMTIAVEPHLKAALEEHARRQERSVSYLARHLLDEALAGYASTPPPSRLDSQVQPP